MAPVPASASDHPAEWKFGYPIYHAETRAKRIATIVDKAARGERAQG